MVVFKGVQMQTRNCAADKAQSLEAPRSWRPARVCGLRVQVKQT